MMMIVVSTTKTDSTEDAQDTEVDEKENYIHAETLLQLMFYVLT